MINPKLIQFFLFVPLAFLVSCQTDEPEVENTSDSEYITRIFEYVYGPGQYSKIAQMNDTLNFIGNPDDKTGWLYLGGFGGYVVAGFDHNIANHDSADFEVYALQGIMPEPAVVYVMQDVNGDGLPNETWYELKGNQFENSKKNYWVKYYKAINDSSNITWLDSDGTRGELICGYGATNSSGWWWPETPGDSITLYGTCLPDSYENNPVNGVQYWTVPKDRFTWGYAENNYGTDYDSSIGANKLDISNAVDSLGNSVYLTDIRFIKVQTGVFQQAGWTNEVSSEVRGAKELK
ncbi:MAG: hypothetical protein PHH37_09690 [Paludibacter sp.]|nr:hypothetical protein [Paludibacter sp.]